MIFENNTTSQLIVWDIFAKGVNTTANTSNFVHFKGTTLNNFVVGPNSTSTFTTFSSSAPTSIVTWRIQNSTVVASQDYLEHDATTLAVYGIQDPLLPAGNKYSYWYGVHITAVDANNAPFLSAIGNPSNLSQSFLGRSAFGYTDTSITFTGTTSTVTTTWALQANGDIKVICQ